MSKKSESKPIKTRVIYGLIWLFAKLPLSITQPLMAFFAQLAVIFNSRSYRVSLVNIQRCYPEKNAKDQLALTKSSLKHTFKIAPEIAKAWLNPSIETWIDKVYGEEDIRETLAQQQGVLITGSHLGNWEVALFYLGKSFDFTCMYRKPRYQELDRIISEGRGKNTTKMVPGDARGLRDFLKALKAGEVAALLSDQEPGGDSGVFAPFFGQPAKTMDLIQKVQTKSGAALYQIAAIKNDRGKYDIYLPKIEIDIQLDPQDYATQLNLELEKLIRKHPQQYQWSYKRFKTAPDGNRNNYPK
ncbi:lysophospholipid acyltransferase family protein [Kangiella sp. TOML190]|uniref:lysophospholipid acyltransferase family protein n=1 Tax=Kangiella sp. TOML190 TaxID=2931351 RepID=UPI00203F438D|nr:lysophospholipid acyltransferase family protein [Kangiella sp. TOML190]